MKTLLPLIASVLVTSISFGQCIDTLPYKENFENGTGGWVEDNTNNGSWAFGTPLKNTITNAASGVNAWTTGGLSTGTYQNNENSWVTSPCFDLSAAMGNEWVALKVWWESEFGWDGANLQYSTDSGQTWLNVGAFGASNNWFNDNNIQAVPGGSVQGWTGRENTNDGSNGWVIAKHPLDNNTLGQPQVFFRIAFAADVSVNDDGFAFDDFAIATPPTINLGNDTVDCANFSIHPGLAGTYAWSIADTAGGPYTTISNQPTLFLTNPSAQDSTFNLQVLYTDTFGLCTADTMRITLLPAPYHTFADSITLCHDATLNLWADTATNHTYAWSTGQSTGMITIDTVGTYSVVVTNTTSGCSHADTVAIDYTTPVALGNDIFACIGDTILLDATMPNNIYRWINGENTATIATDTSGLFFVEATDTILGCFSTDTITVTLSPPANVNLGPDVILCNIDTLLLDAGPGGSYLWSDGSTAQTLEVNGPMLGLGAYTYWVIVNNNGCEVQDDIAVLVTTCPGIDERLGEHTINIYPNPAKEQVHLVISGTQKTEMTLMIFSAQGRQVHCENVLANMGTTTHTIPLSNWAKGMYYLHLSTAKTTVVKRVVVQ